MFTVFSVIAALLLLLPIIFAIWSSRDRKIALTDDTPAEPLDEVAPTPTVEVIEPSVAAAPAPRKPRKPAAKRSRK